MIILIGGSSRATPKWSCLVCETETSGPFANFLRHLNGAQLAGLHGSMKDQICGNTPRVAWCEGCESLSPSLTTTPRTPICKGVREVWYMDCSIMRFVLCVVFVIADIII